MNKIALPEPVKVDNDEDLKTAANLIAENTVKLKSMKAERDSKIQDVQEEHNTRIDALDKAVKSLAAPAQRYLKKHKKRILQDGRKTLRTELATIKMKLNPKKISTIGKAKEADVAEDLNARGLDHLVSVTYSLNKAALLKLSTEKLEELGLKKSQTETISIIPTTDEISKAA